MLERIWGRFDEGYEMKVLGAYCSVPTREGRTTTVAGEVPRGERMFLPPASTPIMARTASVYVAECVIWSDVKCA